MARAKDGGLEARVDALYQRPLTEFTAARNALAKTLTGADAARVKALAKPSIVPWIVNQVYWHARSIHDRLMETGSAVRRAQIAAIEKPGPTPARAQQARDRLRDASDAHRKAVADAVHQALRIAGQHELNPPADAVTRMLEAISLAATPPGSPGRLTDVTQPAGFEALFGVALAPPGPARPTARAGGSPSHHQASPSARAAADAERARRAARAVERREAAGALEVASRAERTARSEADAAARGVKEAEDALAGARRRQEEADRGLERATSDRETAQRRLDALGERTDD